MADEGLGEGAVQAFPAGTLQELDPIQASGEEEEMCGFPPPPGAEPSVFLSAPSVVRQSLRGASCLAGLCCPFPQGCHVGPVQAARPGLWLLPVLPRGPCWRQEEDQAGQADGGLRGGLPGQTGRLSGQMVGRAGVPEPGPSVPGPQWGFSCPPWG